MASTILSGGVRNNLLTLQQTTAQQGVIQNRLATGKKVNSAIDDPVNYFTSLNLNDRASQFGGLLDGISNGIQTIQAASKGLDAITKLVQQAQSTIKQAQGDISSRPSVTSTAAIGTAASVTASGKTMKEVTLASELGGAAATDATASATQKLGGNANNFALTITVGSNSYTDATLTSASSVQTVVDSINKSGLATASVGDDGKLVVKTTTSDALQIGLGSGTDAATATANSKVSSNKNALLGLDTALATAAGAIEPTPSPVRAALVTQFNDLRTQIDQLAKDASYNGVNLLTGDKLSIIFNEKTGTSQNKLDVQGQNIDSDTLGIKKAGTGTYDIDFQSDSALAKASDALIATTTSLRSTASTFGANLGVVQTRQDFSKSMINVLKIGADNLVLADPNEEGASLLALNTRQQLSQTALSLANQADQGVLRLFQ